jgi:hypothetical protein
MRKGRRGDPEIVRSDDFAAIGELGPHLCVNAGNRLCDRHRLERREQMFHECSTLRADRAARAVNTVQELAHGNDANRGVLFDRNRLRAASLALDEEPCVD